MPIIIDLNQLTKVKGDIFDYIQQHSYETDSKSSAAEVSKKLETISEELNKLSLLVANVAGFRNVEKNGNVYLVKAPMFEEVLHTRISSLLTSLPEISDIGYDSFISFSSGINQIITEQEAPQQQKQATKSPPQVAIESDDLDDAPPSPPADESPKFRR